MANYSLGESDLLRRAMGKKNFAIMRENREKFVNRSVENGYTREKAEEIFDLIDKFAGYGFNKSHSVAYAMVSYWTAYLKANYPLFYYAAIMTSEIFEAGDITEYFYDAKEHGVKVYSPNVNYPSSYFTIKDQGIAYSLAAIKNIGLTIAKKITEDFETKGKYSTIEDFVLRNKKNGISKKHLETFILSGALDELKGNRKEKFLSIDKVFDYAAKKSEIDEIQQMNLFGGAARVIDSFNLVGSDDFSLDEKLNYEKELLGFYLSSHPLDKYRNIIEIFSLHKLSDYNLTPDSKIISFGTISNVRKILTKKQETMAWFNLHCYDSSLACVIFPKKFEDYIENIIDKKTVCVEGKIQVDSYKGNETTKLLIDKIEPLENLYNYSEGKLYILIEKNDSYKYSRLKEIINSNKGKTKLIFSMKDEKISKPMDKGVKLSKQFLEDLIELMGQDKVRVKR